MKYTRKEIKSLIKECLIELLAEGLGGTLVESVQPARRHVQQSVRRHDPMLDRRIEPQRVNQRLAEVVRAEAKGNPMMAEILADTAMTTLQEQMAAGDPEASGKQSFISQTEQFNGRPEDVFGDEVASKWADLAFATPTNRPSS
jgi:hypothetical protein